MLSTARVQRGPSEAARCASKESVPVAPAPYGSTVISTNAGTLSAPFLSVTRSLNR
jgi:hypothetical protein